MFLAAVLHFPDPLPEPAFKLIRKEECNIGALNQIGAKPLGAAFGDAVERGVAASTVLLWNQAN